jgi:aspartyl protease family protein
MDTRLRKTPLELSASILAAGLMLAFSAIVHATDVRVVGVFPGKAVVSVDGGAPRTLSVGAKTPEGVRLLAVDGQSATFDVAGARRTLAIGQGFSSGPTGSGGSRTVLQADGRGHFWAGGTVNGGQVRFLVDTGATLIALPADDARRIGISYVNAPRGVVQTANGATTVYRVKLDTVTVGDITMNNVDAVIQEGGLTVALLGMSFLNRTEMRRDGEQMVLVKRF